MVMWMVVLLAPGCKQGHVSPLRKTGSSRKRDGLGVAFLTRPRQIPSVRDVAVLVMVEVVQKGRKRRDRRPRNDEKLIISIQGHGNVDGGLVGPWLQTRACISIAKNRGFTKERWIRGGFSNKTTADSISKGCSSASNGGGGAKRAEKERQEAKE
ncbi:hypothetical protein Ancab_019420 [Ancistrocladus abbreviatus]